MQAEHEAREAATAAAGTSAAPMDGDGSGATAFAARMRERARAKGPSRAADAGDAVVDAADKAPGHGNVEGDADGSVDEEDDAAAAGKDSARAKVRALMACSACTKR